jgi:hypothetical protein
MLGGVADVASRVKLFMNDRVPTKSDVVSDYDEASPSGGYSDRAITRDGWTLAPGPPAIGQHSALIFTWSGPGDPLYGYILVDADGRLLAAERFSSAPYAPTAPGQTLSVVVTIRQQP